MYKNIEYFPGDERNIRPRRLRGHERSQKPRDALRAIYEFVYHEHLAAVAESSAKKTKRVNIKADKEISKLSDKVSLLLEEDERLEKELSAQEFDKGTRRKEINERFTKIDEDIRNISERIVKIEELRDKKLQQLTVEKEITAVIIVLLLSLYGPMECREIVKLGIINNLGEDFRSRNSISSILKYNLIENKEVIKVIHGRKVYYALPDND